jgi:hypothetical protein
MRQYPERLLTSIQKSEGNVQSIRQEANAQLRKKNRSRATAILNRIHPSNSGEGLIWGAYYDSRGYLTAGSGALISQRKRGSKEEVADISKFKTKYGIDPFKMTKDQAKGLIPTKLDENVDAYMASKHGTGVDYDTLPESAKVALGGLVYNVGGTKVGNLGENYSKALKKAVASKSADDWSKFATQQLNFHGTNTQEPSVHQKRKDETFALDDLVYGQSSVAPAGELPLMLRQPTGIEESPVPDIFDNVPLIDAEAETPSIASTLLSNLAPVSSAQATDIDPMVQPEIDGADELPDNFQLLDETTGTVAPVNFNDTMLEDTRFQQQQTELNAAKAEEQRPAIESLERFGNHVVNSFMTENIIGSSAKQAVINWSSDSEYDPTFQPTNMLDYKELVDGVPTENLKDLLGGSNNAEQFRNRAIGFKIEQQARSEMSDYMGTNPISGFVGVGLASALDVTSLIPVSKAANLAGITKAFKGVPLLAKNIGLQIGENVVQDLLQETILTNNSDIRKWDDGEILYGMVGGVILGGAAGKFKTNGTLKKFEKLSQRMNMEKNLSGINMMIRSAEKKGLGKKSIADLKTVKTVIEQSLQKDHQKLVMIELKARQEVMAKGLKDNIRIDTLRVHSDELAQLDAKIESRKPQVINEQMETFKTRKTEISTLLHTRKTELNKQVVPLRHEIAALKKLVKSSANDHKIKKAEGVLEALNKKVKKAMDDATVNQKKLRMEKNKFTRTMGKDDIMNQDAHIQSLQTERVSVTDTFKNMVADFDKSVDDGTHPELAGMLETSNLNNIARDLGLPEVFKSIDEMDEFLGLKFDDSLSAARLRIEPSQYMKAQDVNEMFNKTNPELWNVVSRQFQESRENPALGFASFNVNKDSMAAKIARATRMNELLTTESVVGRFALNKSALKWSKNEFASAFYNWASPDGAGRLGGGKLSVVETQQMLQATYGGDLRTSFNTAMDKLNPLIMSNRQLRNDLGLPSNDLAARLMMTEAYFPEKVSDLLRDEMIEVGNAKLKYGDEVSAVVTSWRGEFNKLTKRVLDDAKEAGVARVDEIDSTDDWFHRSWDNKAAVEFDILHGTNKMEELIVVGMREFLEKEGKVMDDKIITSLMSQAKKFAYGLRSKDTRVFMAADVDYRDFMRRILDADDLSDEAAGEIKREVRRITENVEKTKARELAHRKPISLTASIKLADGTTFQLRNLLERNVLVSQNSYMSSMAGRTASARNGIADVDMLDEWVDRAVELERRRGNLDHADYIEKAMQEDVEAVKYGYAHRQGTIDGSITRLQKMSMKYNSARLMQYTGISSIAEMNTIVAEAGYKAVGQVVVNNMVPLLKSYMLGGVTGKVFTNTMYDELSAIAGVGFEDISFDALLSSSRMITSSRAGNATERVVDNAAKLTRRATGHVETTGRRLALNSLAINYGNIALGKDSVGNMLGGVSNVNLVELGLADLVNGKAIKNKSWDDIMEAIRKNALDEDGKNAMESGKNISQFNLAKWNLKTRQKFGEVLAQQSNHAIVNPDSTTAKLWHSTPVGAMFNQFKTFSNNAQSKVAGHNLTQALQGYKMGEMAEFSKLAQKYFWGAVLGKMSLVLYGSINNAGREDFSDRMEQYMGVDDFRDWTQALGRSSAITGLDSAVDTAIGLGNLSGHMQVDPLFSSSTIGQSRDRLSWQTTATGQLAVGTAAIGTAVAKGDMSAAGKQALKMSPFRRQLGVNQLLNAMGVD